MAYKNQHDELIALITKFNKEYELEFEQQVNDLAKANSLYQIQQHLIGAHTELTTLRKIDITVRFFDFEAYRTALAECKEQIKVWTKVLECKTKHTI